MSKASTEQVEKEQCFTWPVRVYIEDTDAGGIVYYVNYLKFMERARTEFMRSLGFEQKLSIESPVQFVVHSANTRFVKPARMDMSLSVSVRVAKIAKSYFVVEQTVNSEDDYELYCQADIKVACVDSNSFKPIAMPELVQQGLKNI